jgi:hypothetical protein
MQDYYATFLLFFYLIILYFIGCETSVIHTRQLTNGASNELIQSIGNEIKSFIKKYKITI